VLHTLSVDPHIDLTADEVLGGCAPAAALTTLVL